MELWQTWFARGESPYLAMYRAGINGIPVDAVIARCTELGISLRPKDIENYEDGKARKVISAHDRLNPKPFSGTARSSRYAQGLQSLPSYESWPDGWNGTERRWFPCNDSNMPMQKWGYSPGFTPQLYTRGEAQALAMPPYYVGQNMYAQPFIVIDIDGEGHGIYDEETIAWGRKYQQITESWQSPDKPGSFHLYFRTNKVIPIQHFPYAHIDLMGNQKNAAVYTKNKVCNGLPRAELTEEIWNDLKRYVEYRKENRSL